MNNGGEILVVLVLLAMVIVLIIVGPIFTIWSLNTLFQMEIPYNFQTWVAMVWVHTILHGVRASFKKTSNQQADQ